ncbi:unnamed protein product [Heterosigma akashiwo]
MMASNLPRKYWSEAVLYSAHTLNRAYTRSIFMSPYEKLFKRKPSVRHFRTFGSDVCVHIPKEQRPGKLSDRGMKCKFLSYNSLGKTYNLLNEDTGKIIVSRDCIFDERKVVNSSIDVTKTREDFNANSHQDSNETAKTIFYPLLEKELAAAAAAKATTTTSALPPPTNGNSGPPPSRRRRTRVDSNSTRFLAPTTFGSKRSSRLVSVKALNEIRRLKKKAVAEEYNSLIEHDVWELADPPANTNIVGCRWILAKNAPALRTILSIGASQDMELHSMDIKTAFLYASLEKEVYMHQPAGYVIPGSEDKVLRWYENLHNFLTSQGYHRNSYESCIYTKVSANGLKTHLSVYFGDLVIASSDTIELQRIKRELAIKYRVSDLGELNSILGLKIDRNRK